MTQVKYKAIISSDWNECLAPCGPFDCISFNHPQLEAQLTGIFRQYTGNRIFLGEAIEKIQQLLPAPITPEQMDAYLDASFATYPGVADLIEWCLSSGILFMINTTGMLGYFQRAFAKGLLPCVPALSAHPMIRFAGCSRDPQYIYALYETPDKSKNTAAAIGSLKIPAPKVILLGDSGGDGPHFEWGAKTGAFLVGCMTKPSLDRFCRDKGISMNLRFGPDYSSGGEKDKSRGQQANFMDMAGIIERIVAG